MTPVGKFVKLAIESGIFEDVYTLSESPADLGLPAAGRVFLRQPAQDEPPPRKHDGLLFVHVDLIVNIDPLDSRVIGEGYYGPRPGWATARHDEDGVATVINSNIPGVVAGDQVLTAGDRVGVELTEGRVALHVDQIYGIKRKP